MLNSLRNPIFDAEGTGSPELIAAGSALRLNGILLFFVAAVLIILVRVCWVQTRLPGKYLVALQVTSTEDEPLPARDGRILADSIVLASDIDVYRVEIHYRWLQKVIDPQWLRLQIRKRLSRDERRNVCLIKEVENQIGVERTSLRDALAEVTQIPAAELAARFCKVEERVQRISDAVNRRQTGSKASVAEKDPKEHPGVLMAVAESIRAALTTPPMRAEESRIVVRDEETWHPVLEDVSITIAAMINEHPERFPGVRVVSSTRRTYPEQTLAAHVVGVRTNVRDSDLTGYSAIADLTITAPRVGRSGVERSYDHELLGGAGVRRTIRDRRQRVISSKIVRHPVSGRDVTVTLDSRLQQLSEQLLAESLGDAPRLLLPAMPSTENSEEETATEAEPQPIPVGGCVIVMEADSGRLLAAASAPTFDLSMFVDGSPTMWNAVNSDTRRPFVRSQALNLARSRRMRRSSAMGI